jgi:hypothetical protein
MPTNILAYEPDVESNVINISTMPYLNEIQIPSNARRIPVYFAQHIRDRDDPCLLFNIAKLGYFCPNSTMMNQTYTLAHIKLYVLTQICSESIDFEILVQMELMVFGNIDVPISIPSFTQERPE